MTGRDNIALLTACCGTYRVPEAVNRAMTCSSVVHPTNLKNTRSLRAFVSLLLGVVGVVWECLKGVGQARVHCSTPVSLAPMLQIKEYAEPNRKTSKVGSIGRSASHQVG